MGAAPKLDVAPTAPRWTPRLLEGGRARRYTPSWPFGVPWVDTWQPPPSSPRFDLEHGLKLGPTCPHVSKGVPWVPVYRYGCGWVECPDCGPHVELEILELHRKKVQATYPRYTEADRVSEWTGELAGTVAPRGPKLISIAERKAARGTQATYRAMVRVKRTLTVQAREEAGRLLAEWPTRKEWLRGGKPAWLAEVWLELTNPSKLVAGREKRMPLERRIKKAVARVAGTLHRASVKASKITTLKAAP